MSCRQTLLSLLMRRVCSAPIRARLQARAVLDEMPAKGLQPLDNRRVYTQTKRARQSFFRSHMEECI